MKAGAHAVKVEGLPDGGEIIRLLVRSGIPVMGHLGLTPQAVHTLGGFRVQGRDAAGASQLLKDAKTLAAAGVFAMVLECVPRVLARRITRAVPVPTIGIGAGKDCDGQVLVLHDLLGLNPEFHPRFARRFADGAALVRLATGRYASAVRKGSFPAAKEAFAS
jgi:3-methyl-2-oxobutanoate hydroxymethyltransferase